MATFTRTTSNLIGSPASAATIAASASSSGTNSVGSGNNNASAFVSVRLINGSSPPASNPTVQFSYTLDGTNYLLDGGPLLSGTGASTSYDFGYTPPQESVGHKVTITNGATNSITAWAQSILESIT